MAKTPIRNEFTKHFERLLYRFQPWQVWADFITMTAAAISCATDPRTDVFKERAEQQQLIMSRYSDDEKMVMDNLFDATVNALEENPWQDYLGNMYMAIGLGDHWKGQFFTPYHVCEAMARMSLSNIADTVEKKGYATINDPACGAGATLIAGANVANDILAPLGLNYQKHVAFIGQDLDAVTAMMCYIQLSFLGCAGYVKIGNTLADPARSGDDKTAYWYTPMWMSDIWTLRRTWHGMDAILEGAVK